MSDKCESCGQGLPDYYDLSQTRVIERVLNQYNDGTANKYYIQGWDVLLRMDVGDSVEIPNLGLVEMVHKVDKDYDLDTYTQPLEMVLKITQPDSDEPRFFKRTGEYTSYDGISWGEGYFKEVASTPKQVLVWE